VAGLDTGCYCFRHIMLDAPKYNALKTETTDGEILELEALTLQYSIAIKPRDRI